MSVCLSVTKCSFFIFLAQIFKQSVSTIYVSQGLTLSTASLVYIKYTFRKTVVLEAKRALRAGRISPINFPRSKPEMWFQDMAKSGSLWTTCSSRWPPRSWSVTSSSSPSTLRTMAISSTSFQRVSLPEVAGGIMFPSSSVNFPNFILVSFNLMSMK